MSNFFSSIFSTTNQNPKPLLHSKILENEEAEIVKLISKGNSLTSDEKQKLTDYKTKFSAITPDFSLNHPEMKKQARLEKSIKKTLGEAPSTVFKGGKSRSRKMKSSKRKGKGKRRRTKKYY